MFIHEDNMTWIDKIRAWDYDITVVFSWLWGVVLYNAERHGPIAYLVALVVVVLLLLAFPPTRALTKTTVGGIFRMATVYIQLVASLVTVQLLGFIFRLLLTMFHKARIWVLESIRRFREAD